MARELLTAGWWLMLDRLDKPVPNCLRPTRITSMGRAPRDHERVFDPVRGSTLETCKLMYRPSISLDDHLAITSCMWCHCGLPASTLLRP